jgi:hypothetical protein
MKRITLVLCATTFLFACNNDKKAGESKTLTDSTTTQTDDNSKSKPMVEVDSATRMKNWQEYMTPGPMHKMMSSWDGVWDADVTMWMPDAPEQKSKSTAFNKTIMNGLYQESEHSGNIMGMPFSGKSTTGYDNHLHQFVSTWVDNMGSGIMVMHGTWDSTSKMITFKGKMVDPETKGECEMRQTFKIVDDNTHEMEMFGPDRKTGQEVKTMLITYKRRK